MQKIKIKNKRKNKGWYVQQAINNKLAGLVQLALDNYYKKLTEARKASKVRVTRGLSSL